MKQVRWVTFTRAVNLYKLYVFAVAARHGNFSRAAQDLLLTQPGVSKHIGDLERTLGVRLFERRGRQVRLSPAGEAFYRHAQEVLRQAEEAWRALLPYREPEGGVLQVAASTTPGIYILPALLKKYVEREPRVQVRLEIATSDQVLQAVLSGSVELGFIGMPPSSERVQWVPFVQDPLVLVASPHHPLAREPRATLARVLRETVVVHSEGSGIRLLMEQVLGSSGQRLARSLELNSLEAIKESVAEGLGVSFLPARVVEREVRAGRLTVVPLADVSLKRQLGAIYLKGHPLSPSARRFLGLILSSFSLDERE